MNKVITINLCGAAYQLEEGGYDTLSAYLDTAVARLQGNPDRDEILSDIERAIGEKFRALLGNYKTVVVASEVAAVIAEMGPIEADSGGEAANTAASSTGKTCGEGGQDTAGEEKGAWASGTRRRLYRIPEGAMISGVCNGLAAYLNMDPTFVRLAFVFLTMAWGTGVLVYIVMAIVVPEARSPEQKAAASGIPLTAQEFIRRAKAGYYEALKGFPDRKARREWRHRIKRDLWGWRMSFEREMRANMEQWQRHWRGYSAQHASCHPAAGFALPFVSLLHGMATILCLCAIISLLSTGALFGMALPANLPVWAAALLLLIAYGIFTGPLKAIRRAYYWNYGPPGPAHALIMLLDEWSGWQFLPLLSGLPSIIFQRCVTRRQICRRWRIMPRTMSGPGGKR